MYSAAMNGQIGLRPTYAPVGGNSTTMPPNGGAEAPRFENDSDDPLIPVVILGYAFPALLDTGSSVSILGRIGVEAVMASGLKLRVAHTTLMYPTGRSAEVKRRATVTMTWHFGLQTEVDFLLLPDMDMPAILGRNFLVDMGIDISIVRRAWAFSARPMEYFAFCPNFQFWIPPANPTATNGFLPNPLAMQIRHNASIGQSNPTASGPIRINMIQDIPIPHGVQVPRLTFVYRTITGLFVNPASIPYRVLLNDVEVGHLANIYVTESQNPQPPLYGNLYKRVELRYSVNGEYCSMFREGHILSNH